MGLRTTFALLVIAGCSSGASPTTKTAGPATEPGPIAPGKEPGQDRDPGRPAAGTGAAAAASAPAGGSAAPAPPSPSSSADTVKVTLADIGLEAASLDRSSDPCVDFYQFACGGWLASNAIPPDRPGWARFVEISERNQAALRTILEDAAQATGGDAATRKLGDFYASCVDEPALERAGTAGLRKLLDRLAAVKDARTWAAAIAELHRLGVWVVWRADAEADWKASSTHVTYLDGDGLGLPDRDYYAKPELKDRLDAYRQHVTRMLALARPGAAPARVEAAAGDVLAIEGELAKLTKSAVDKRDVHAAYNAFDARKLAATVTSVDWRAYWKALGVTPSARIIVGTPKLFAQIDKLRARFKGAQWASYFTFHLAEQLAIGLPRAFDAEAFELQKLLRGTERQRERGNRCVELTGAWLGELLGQHYTAKYFPASSRQSATVLVDAMIKVMSEELGKLDWMTEPTRQLAQAKLAKIVRMVGYPDRWRSYDFEVRRDDLLGNLLRGRAFDTRRRLARAGKPVDRGEWPNNAYVADAWYDASANSTVLPAGILQPPFFGHDRSIAANLGGIGMVIGHELTHGFDDQGAQFDGDGNLVNWWHQDDRARFEARSSCLVDQYATFEMLPRQYVHGRLTLGENIADLGGVKMAFNAYRQLRRDATRRYIADGFDEDQQFFIAVAQAWCAKDRPVEAQRRLTVDPHSPPKFRVYGALRNLPDFASAFRCAPGTPMKPARTCSVW